MTVRIYIAAKLHGITVTRADNEYTGSVSVDPYLLDLAGIDHYEQVSVVNLNNGNRWETYVIPGAPGEFALCGGGARLGIVGDRCIVMTYRMAIEFPGVNVVMIDGSNKLSQVIVYPNERRVT